MTRKRHSNPSVTQDVFLSLQKILRCLDLGKGLRGKVPSLTITQMRVLSFFNDNTIIHISEISPVLGMSLQSVNNVVHRLEAAGYITRTPNRQNKRFSDIVLTPLGKKLLRAFQNSQFDSLGQILEPLAPAERRALSCSLKNAAAILERKKRIQDTE